MSQTIHKMDTETSKIRTPLNRLRMMGIFWIILGVVAIAAAMVATVTTVFLFGLLLLLAGLALLGHAFPASAEDRSWSLFAGALYTLVGSLLVLNPLGGAQGLTLLLALFFLFNGISRVFRGIRFSQHELPAGGYYFGGALNLLLALLILLGWPQTGNWIIGLFVGVELVIGGLMLTSLTSLVKATR